MAERRWQPPPMSDGGHEDSAAKVRVDEQIVRKMLQVNPALRKGRTTQQVKRALEQGGSIATEITGRSALAGATPAAGAAAQLEDTIASFMRGKAAELEAALTDLQTRRRALEEEEKRVRARAREQVGGFLGLLEPGAVEAYGVVALAKHHELLRALGASADELLAAARRRRR